MMKIGLSGGNKASEKDIAALEAVIGRRLDERFRMFIDGNNGAKPEDNSFPVNGVSHVGGVTEFIPIEHIIREREYISDITTGAFPFASSECGNYVILDQIQGGSIFFWDHEIEGGLSKLAENFDVFLNMIEPFDISKIQPASGQVRTAWIDPDFLKEFGN